jgi:hypothetical protein
MAAIVTLSPDRTIEVSAPPGDDPVHWCGPIIERPTGWSGPGSGRPADPGLVSGPPGPTCTVYPTVAVGSSLFAAAFHS